MPHHPEDDWTRPMPRSDGGRSAHGDPGPDLGEAGYYDERGDYVPRGRSRRAEAERTTSGARAGARRERRAAGETSRGTPRQTRSTRAHRRPRYGIRRFFALLALLIVGYLVWMVVVVSMIWGSVNRLDATPDVADRPSGGAGSTFLLVGTDSREQLTEEERSDFGTGFTEGHRADTVMLLHVPTFGDPTLVSLPRDSYVAIRDQGWNKLNAAHSSGGPELLVDTVEQATGLGIDGYMEIGFGGFVSVVDGVGGVEMCLDQPAQDEKAHIDLPAGCQELSGADALGYVRMRYNDPRGDIGRVERQREFLSALVDKLLTPSTIFVPWRLEDAGTSTAEAISLGDDTSLVEAGRMALAMRSVAGGTGTSLTVPVADPNYATEVGSAVLWNEEQATRLFTALRQGEAITVEP